MERDDVLRSLFNQCIARFSGTDRGGALAYKTEYEVYYISRTCVFCGAPTKADKALKLNVFEPYKGNTGLTLTDITKVRPEVMLAPESVKITESDISGTVLLPVEKSPIQSAPAGLWILKGSAGVYEYVGTIEKSQNVTSGMKLRPFIIDVPMDVFSADNVEMQSFSPEIMRSVLGGFAVLMLTADSALAYLTSTSMDADGGLSVSFASGDVVVGDGYVGKGVFKKLIKKRSTKMKGLGNPLTGKKEKVVEAPAQEQKVKAEEPAPEVKPPVPVAAAPVQEKVKEETPVVPAKKAQEPVETPETPASETTQTEEQPDQAVRRRRVKPSSTFGGIDYTKIREQIDTDIPTITADDADKVMDELRMMRDLKLALERRHTNMALAAIKSMQGAAERLKAIMSVMGK